VGRHNVGNELAQSVQHLVLPQSKVRDPPEWRFLRPYMSGKHTPHNAQCYGCGITFRQFWTQT